MQELYLEATKIHDAGQGEYLDTRLGKRSNLRMRAAGAALDNESATDAELLNALDTLQAAIDGLTVEEPSEHTLRVEYDSNVTLLVNGEKPPFADLLGSYTAEVMGGRRSDADLCDETGWQRVCSGLRAGQWRRDAS